MEDYYSHKPTFPLRGDSKGVLHFWESEPDDVEDPFQL